MASGYADNRIINQHDVTIHGVQGHVEGGVHYHGHHQDAGPPPSKEQKNGSLVGKPKRLADNAELPVQEAPADDNWDWDIINDETGDPKNCWLCSIGGRYRIQVSRLLSLLDNPKGAASKKDILFVYNQLNCKVESKDFVEWNDVKRYLNNRLLEHMDQNKKDEAKLKVLVGLDVKGDRVSHMVVLKARKVWGGDLEYRLIDFQKNLGNPLRRVENKLPDYAKPPFLIIETKDDVN